MICNLRSYIYSISYQIKEYIIKLETNISWIVYRINISMEQNYTLHKKIQEIIQLIMVLLQFEKSAGLNIKLDYQSLRLIIVKKEQLRRKI